MVLYKKGREMKTMKALLVLDVQKGFVSQEHQDQLDILSKLMNKFEKENWPIIAFQHIDTNPQSMIQAGTKKGEVIDSVSNQATIVMEKRFPIVYKGTKLEEVLQKYCVSEVYLCGFNMEFCVLFTAIASADRGYRTVVVEDACGTVNTPDTYEMNGLDIIDFVGSVLDWSGVVEDLYYEELEWNIGRTENEQK